jgi:hypothetical protein
MKTLLRSVVATLAIVGFPWAPVVAQTPGEIWLDCRVTETSVTDVPNGPRPETATPAEWVLRFNPGTDTVHVGPGPADGRPIAFVPQGGALDPNGGGSYFRTSVSEAKIVLTWDKIAPRGQSHAVYIIDRVTLSISTTMNSTGVGWASRGQGSGTCTVIPPQPVARKSF